MYLFRLSKVNMEPSVAVMFCLALVLAVSYVNPASTNYASARIESCGGCSLNRHPDVQKFIYKDVPEYDNVEFKHIQGAVPELVLLNENDEEVERLPLSKLTREECNNLLISKGFKRASQKMKDEM